MKSLEDPDMESNGKHKSGLMVPLVLEVQPQHMNLTGRMARNNRFADDEVTIQFYADAVRQLRSTEVSATPKSEDGLQRIIKAQRDRIHPYPYLSDTLRLDDWSDSQWSLDDAYFAMDKYYMARMTSLEQTLYQLNPTRQELDWTKQHAQRLYDGKKAYKPGSPVEIMCSIEAVEECIARKSHELATRQASTTLTTEASPLPLPALVQPPPSGEAPLAQSSRAARQWTRSAGDPIHFGSCSISFVKGAKASPDETSVSQGFDSDVEVGAVPGRRAAGSSTTSA